MLTFLPSIVATVVLLALLWWLQNRPLLAVGVLLAATICSLAMHPASMVTGLACLVVWFSWICALATGHSFAVTTRVCVIAAAPMCAILAACLIVPLELKVARYTALRDKYPLISLEDRLAYEPVAPPVEPRTLSPSEELRLEEYRGSYRSRDRALRAVHDRTFAEFQAAAGFGRSRMIRVHPELAEYQAPAPVPLPHYEPADESASAEQPLAETPPAQPVDSSQWNNWRQFHLAGANMFTNSLGYVAGPRLAAGFEPHAMRPWAEEIESQTLGTRWQLVRLELVSLLKHSPPWAYLSKNLPRMDELRDAPTRPLDTFETPSLVDLDARDVIVAEQPDKLRMLGAIRANQSCLGCHHVRRGDLLGAFTYEFRPKQPQLAPKAAPAASPAANLPRT